MDIKKATDAEMRKIVDEAHLAGMVAVSTCKPVPMGVCSSDGKLIEVVDDGVCGFAWIVVRPAGSRFGRYLSKNGIGRTAYGGGIHIWVSQYSQSMTKKETYAEAYAEVLRKYGIEASSGSRMD